MNYEMRVKLSLNIKTFAFALACVASTAPAAFSAELTSKEKEVCSSLPMCVDIISRHDASEFDYNILESQFRRFGPLGREALLKVLNSKSGNADIAKMIVTSGPLSATERLKVKREWSVERADAYIPLLLDGNPLSRDFLLLSLGSHNPATRELARQGLIKLSKTADRQPLSSSLRAPLLRALVQDPITEAAPYLARLSVGDASNKFAALLRSGDRHIVSASYDALFRANQSKAFSLLLSEMGRAQSAAEARAIGEMLVARHSVRSDGFYLKFARDISGDKTRSISARASGLHAVLISGVGELPEFTPERAEALSFLVKAEPFVTEAAYLPVLKRAKSEDELNLIWGVAQAEQWINRDRIVPFFHERKLEGRVIRDLIESNDFRSVMAGIERAKLEHKNSLQRAANHPFNHIADLARKKLGLSPVKTSKASCLISTFDAQDNLNQMPFFDRAWLKTESSARVALQRRDLTTAHPAKTGWIAGYDLSKRKTRPSLSGGVLAYFENKTGDFSKVGDFSGPVTILPNRTIKLGETTETFWVIDSWGDKFSELSAYLVILNGANPIIRHIGVLPSNAQGFTVAPNGNLLMRFTDKKQAPVRLTQTGDLSLACAAARPSYRAPAPN